jgi:hypothetical protein
LKNWPKNIKRARDFSLALFIESLEGIFLYLCEKILIHPIVARRVYAAKKWHSFPFWKTVISLFIIEVTSLEKYF